MGCRQLSEVSTECLRKNYVPDVYQKSIFCIDYDRLWKAGKRGLSFDLDDTLGGALEDRTGPKRKEIELIRRLKNMGFRVMLFSNASESRVSDYAEKLGIRNSYVADANKPNPEKFEAMQKRMEVEKSQMVHIGNSLRKDVHAARSFGITACLVRRRGFVGGIPSTLTGKNRQIAEELGRRGIWKKHHVYASGDQYYQYGEEPPYRRHWTP